MCINKVSAFEMEDLFILSNSLITRHTNHISNSKKTTSCKNSCKNLDY